ncbi:MAG: DCC1-like thiol-disulfide oxidoreductase family protein [Pyrinomonadaceae bacterium]
MSEPDSISVVLYDGVCGLCNRLNQFLLKRDRHDRFRFASLQSDVAAQLLQRHGTDAVDLDTVYVVVDYGKPGEKLLSRSDAIMHVLQRLGGIWAFAAAGKVLPKPLRDACYKVVAANRYRVFGKYDVCLMPDERYKNKFL